MNKTKIYLDIDGVLLANERYPARHVNEFLDLVTKNYSTFWLTTHCRGDAEATVEHLARVLDSRTLELTKNIKPTNWDELKTEAIDFAHPFLWFDDDLFDKERDVLIKNNALESWIEVDLRTDPHQLLSFVRNFPITRQTRLS